MLKFQALIHLIYCLHYTDISTFILSITILLSPHSLHCASSVLPFPLHRYILSITILLSPHSLHCASSVLPFPFSSSFLLHSSKIVCVAFTLSDFHDLVIPEQSLSALDYYPFNSVSYFTTAITFLPVNCGIPTEPLNGTIESFQSTLGGAEIFFMCNSRFVPAGRMRANCTSPDGVTTDGTWSPDPATLTCNGEKIRLWVLDKHLVHDPMHIFRPLHATLRHKFYLMPTVLFISIGRTLKFNNR